MKVAILGFGIEGRSALDYWQKQHADITICDQNQQLVAPADVSVRVGDDYLHGLEEFDVVCRTASINREIILAASPGIEAKITTVVDEFLRVCPTANTIGVTGTKGKGTTSTLITHLLEACGKQVFLGGNIGRSPLDFLPELTPESWVVLELSSYQLSDITHSPHIGVCLMFSPEHLNWHKDIEDYAKAKANMFKFQKPTDTAIYYANDEVSHSIASMSPGAKMTYFAEPGAYITDETVMIDNQEVCKISEIKLLGKHNLQNICAAVTVVWGITQDLPALHEALANFQGLEHRLEFVRAVGGVMFYNDSFGSAPPATVAAIDAIPGTKVLIIGGFDRLLPLEELAKTVQEHQENIRSVLLIGASAQRVGVALHDAGYTNYFISPAKTMAEVVSDAQRVAQPGDAVILSPGFPSFDMFKNFEDRGLQFKQVVQQL